MYQQVLGSQTLFAHLDAGASEFNGATTYDATTYVARAEPARLDELLSIEAVRAGLRCVSITDSVFEREREVVINELRQRSEASALRAALHGAAFAGGHPYRISLGGTDASVADVRHQLGASYSLGAYLESHRLASEYVLEGFVESGRAEEAIKLLGARVAALRDDPDAAARAFVIARARVVTRLRSIGGGASSLAARSRAMSCSAARRSRASTPRTPRRD